MLIRKSASEVFNTLIDPEHTKHFWFTNGSNKLEENKEVTWTWGMYNFSMKVMATEIVKDKKIKFNWYTSEKPTVVNISFKAIASDVTFVEVKHSGFDKTGDELIEAVKDSCGGFALVLAGLKSYLEHGINLNLVRDKFPKELMDH